MRTCLLLCLLITGCLPADLVDRAKDRDGDGYIAWQLGGPDCDDSDVSIHPQAEERCGDGIDNNCDGLVDDDGLDAREFHVDADGDGYGDPARVDSACAPGNGLVDNALDCDDDAAAVSPDATEVCGDGIDNDCDGHIDDNGIGARTFQIDADLDGFGNPDATGTACQLVEGLADNGLDCDDTDDDIHPDADEICGDGVDNNCDGRIDDDGIGARTFQIDADLDGYGDPDATGTACRLVEGLAENALDCDDTDDDIHPDADEICGDGQDNDCDGHVDDDGIGSPTWYADLDGDDHTSTATVSACAQPDDYLPTPSSQVDCNDDDPDIHPDADEIWYDGIDQDCDGADDYDQDGDGYRSAVESLDGQDCDDLRADVSPAESEICGNHLDDDCDGTHNDCAPTGSVDIATLDWARIDLSSLALPGERLSIGDIDGDGLPDVGLGGYARDVVIFHGPLVGTNILSDAAVHISSPTTDDEHFSSFSIEGDYNGDERNDLVIGRHEIYQSDAYWGDALVFFAPLYSSLTPAGASRRYTGPYPDLLGNDFGLSVGSGGDPDGDGRDTVVIGQPDVYGRCWLFEAPLPNSGSALDRADVRIDDDGSSTTLCKEIQATDDLTGDAVPDLVVGAPGTQNTPGSVNLFTEYPAAVLSPEDATASVVADAYVSTGDHVASRHDLSGDDVLDIAFTSLGPSSNGRVYVAFGPFDGERSTAAAAVWIDPEGGAALDIYKDVATGDFNGDGVGDLAFTGLLAPDGERVVYLYYGPLETGIHSTQDADAVLSAPSEWEPVGAIEMEDLDGDGFAEIIATAGPGAFVIHGTGR